MNEGLLDDFLFKGLSFLGYMLIFNMKLWLQWDCCLFHVPFRCWISWGSELMATFWTSHSMTHRSPPWHFPALNPAAETKTSDIDSTSFQVITYHHIIHHDVQVILKNGLIWKFLELQTKRWWSKTPSKETPFFSSPCVLRNGHAGRLRTCHQWYRLLQLLGVFGWRLQESLFRETEWRSISLKTIIQSHTSTFLKESYWYCFL